HERTKPRPRSWRRSFQRVEEGDPLRGADGSAEAGDVRSVDRCDASGVRDDVDRGHVAEADDPFRTRREGAPWKLLEDPHRAVPTARTDDGFDVRIGHRR